MGNMKTILYLYGLLLALAITAESADQYCRIICKASHKKKPVCASDRQSYPSKCEVRRQRICFGKKNLEWIHEGECREGNEGGELSTIAAIPEGVYALPKQYEDKTTEHNCTVSRLKAIEESQKIAEKTMGATANNVSTHGIPVIIPDCKADGSYEDVQCHPISEHCWCVNPETGAAIPHTTLAYARPSCGASEEEERGRDTECSDTVRPVFNSRLLELFSTSYNEVTEEVKRKLTADYVSIQGMTEDNSKVAAWRFNSLDIDGDKQLTSQEIRELRREVRKKVKPKACSKLFLSYCDKDSDSIITYQEWNFCLGGNTKLSFRLFLSLNAMGPQELMRGWSGDVLPIHDQSQSSDHKSDKNSPDLMEHQKRLFNMLSGEPSAKDREESGGGSSSRLRNSDAGGNDRIDRSPLNDQTVDINRKLVSLAMKTCMDERTTALAKSDDQKFVPVCQADGRYERTQCHGFSGYCWCVYADSGLPISGTSRLKESPNCESVEGQPSGFTFVPNPGNSIKPTTKSVGGKGARGKKRKSRKKLREIPGCPSPNHGAFLTQLVDLLTREMASAGGSLPAELTNSANMSLEEKAIRWKAISADRNNDQKLSKKEMRFVRHMVKEKLIKVPEKCAKKFMRYCDLDRDDYITVNELLICTEVRKKARRNQRKQQSSSGGDNIRHNANRNPFTDLLKPS